MLKKTSAAGGLVVAATAAGILLTGSPASAQVPTWHGHHRWSSHHHNRNANRNVNVNRNRIIVRVRVHNRNNNIAVARNDNFGFRFRRHRDFDRDCCFRRTRFRDDDDGFIGRRRFLDGDRDGARAVIRGDDVFARAGDALAFVD
ncbi:hypothetical protein GCM10023196_083990 [Actinoallomurus vinaceus]|uniref:Uncharacterized protein n=1 Tax=Actinoallomurus vinaceus TaxID=1080074 RepID=A0ABP8UPA0_9ACTN